MKIVFVSSELEPYTHGSAQASLCASLARALRRSNHDVSVFAPYPADTELSMHTMARKLNPIAVELFGREHLSDVYTARTSAGVETTLIRLRDGQTQSAEERDLIFTKSVVEILKLESPRCDVTHAHGSSATTTFLWCDEEKIQTRKIATLYEAIPGSPATTYTKAIGLANSVTVLSEELEKETQKLLGPGVEGPVLTIGMGLDTALWNPTVDPHLPTRFDPYSLAGKAMCKAALQKELDLPVRTDVPLIGIALLGDAAQELLSAFVTCGPEALQNNVHILLVSHRDIVDLSLLDPLLAAFPERLRVHKRNEPLGFEHRAFGATDALILPPLSAIEQQHLVALRYGSVPVVASHSLASKDIVDCDSQLTTGSGFVYDSLEPHSLLSALGRVCAAYQDLDAYRKVQARIMLIDHSWQRTVRRYERLYNRSTISGSAN